MSFGLEWTTLLNTANWFVDAKVSTWFELTAPQSKTGAVKVSLTFAVLSKLKRNEKTSLVCKLAHSMDIKGSSITKQPAL